MNIALIASSIELAQKILLTKPEALQFDICVFSSINDFFERSQDSLWSGFITDARTMIAPSLKKAELLTLSSVYPFMRVRNESNGSLSGSISSQNFRSDQMWSEFLDHHCAIFKARRIRSYSRNQGFLPVEVRGIGDGTKIIQTYCLDYSQGGAYILGQFGQLSPSATDLKKIELRFRDDASQQWLEAEMLWSVPWESKLSRSKPAGFAVKISQWTDFILAKLPS